MAKNLMTGNEAVARGLYEAGVAFASAYPGTPSTEILENVAEKYKDSIACEWAPNEKVAFEAAVGLLKKYGKSEILDRCYQEAKEQLNGPDSELTNCVKPIYDPFTDRELAAAIADLLRPEGLRAELALVFQSCADLADCCPNHRGDWYFTGEYPTPGGFRVVNRALVNYVEHIDARAY